MKKKVPVKRDKKLSLQPDQLYQSIFGSEDNGIKKLTQNDCRKEVVRLKTKDVREQHHKTHEGCPGI